MRLDSTPSDATTKVLHYHSEGSARGPLGRRTARRKEPIPLELCRRHLRIRHGDQLLHLGLLPHLVVDTRPWPFDDASADCLVSLFDQQVAQSTSHLASEMARVTRPGGGLALAAWTEASYAAELFATLHARTSPPWQRGESGPLDWSRPDRLEAAFGEAFELSFEYIESNRYADTPAGLWDRLLEETASLRALANGLGGDTLTATRQEYLTRCRSRFGNETWRPQTYLMAIGRRR